MDPLKVGGALVVDSMSTQIPTSEVYLVIPSFRVTDSISEYLSSEKPKNGGEKPSTAQTWNSAASGPRHSWPSLEEDPSIDGILRNWMGY